MSGRQFTQEEAREIGERIGIDWGADDVNLDQFRMGLAVELEHGSRDPATDVTHDDEVITGKIALAHLREIPTTTRACLRWRGMRNGSNRQVVFGSGPLADRSLSGPPACGPVGDRKSDHDRTQWQSQPAHSVDC